MSGRRVVALSLALALLAVLVAGGSLLYAVRRELNRPLPHPQPVVFELPPGVGFRAATHRLAEAGLIRWPLALEAYARARHLTGSIKSGRYRFVGPRSSLQVLAQLTSGTAGGDVAVVFPEGLTRWEVAARLEQAGICPAAAFLATLTDDQEGRLFPDTYRLFPDSTPAEAITAMTGRFEAVWGELRRAHQAGLATAEAAGLGERQLLVLASLVEKEARLPDERPLIARVFLNRLARGWMLQSDPTCVYGAASWSEVPSPARCHDPTNPYSTYVRRGLPPGPIASPGRASLQAVLAPAASPESLELMFFVARRDGSGGHDFSRTGAEHEAKVDRYLRSKR